jgi:bifunctional DNA-binding transcriptional regulator/antitoxin component of YhaV-PrlF toxin-antitoxin module
MPATTRIVSKFQVTVPPEIRQIFDLREGDLFEWDFDAATNEIRVIAKRAEMITPQIRELEEQVKSRRAAERKLQAAVSR